LQVAFGDGSGGGRRWWIEVAVATRSAASRAADRRARCQRARTAPGSQPGGQGCGGQDRHRSVIVLAKPRGSRLQQEPWPRKPGRDRWFVERQRLAETGSPVAKAGVNAGPVDAHRISEIGPGPPFVAQSARRRPDAHRSAWSARKAAAADDGACGVANARRYPFPNRSVTQLLRVRLLRSLRTDRYHESSRWKSGARRSHSERWGPGIMGQLDGRTRARSRAVPQARHRGRAADWRPRRASVRHRAATKDRNGTPRSRRSAARKRHRRPG